MIQKYYKEWAHSGEMTDDLANGVYEQLDGIMEEAISTINQLTQRFPPRR